ncbi:MAG: aldo/keto reductase [Chloroflexota bacterium]
MNATDTNNHLLPASIEIGTGTWQWGDRIMWGFGGSYGDDDVRQAFKASLDAGITFYDTAELYGFGTSEKLLGRFIRETNASVLVATKFLPYPWRVFKGQLMSALRGSLRRLGLPSVDLYQIHFPSPPIGVETWANALADALDQGLTRAVGVSNYSRMQTIRSHAVLAQRGYPLATNQVEYNLLNRTIERDGTLESARDRGIKIIAYSPLAKGLLTGKYTVANPPQGLRRMVSRTTWEILPKLLERMKLIGDAHGGKSMAQVALNWTICKGTLPIPGAKNPQQAQHNAGAVGWRLTDDEVAELDRLST